LGGVLILFSFCRSGVLCWEMWCLTVHVWFTQQEETSQSGCR